MRVASYDPRYRDELLGFLRRVLAGYPYKADPAYFDWMFAGNPLGPSLDTYALLLADDGTIIGQIGTMRDRLRIDGQWVDALWIVDLVIDEAFRGGLGARQLFKRAMGSARIVMATGVASRILPIYRSLGWQCLTPVRARYHVLRPGRLLALASTTETPPEMSKATRLALAGADRVMPLAARARTGVQRVVGGPRRVEIVARLDAFFDDDIARIVEACGITEYRSAALLNWKFVERPVGKHRVLALRSDSGRLRGLMVLKWMERPSITRWLEIADYLVHPDDAAAFRMLVRQAESTAAADRLDFVRFRLAHPAHVALLRPPTWVDHTRPSVDDVFVFTKEPTLLSAVTSSPWHLTSLASDRNETGRDEWPAQPTAVAAPLFPQ